MKESNLSKTYLPKWQKENGIDSHLFRNNTGSAYQGEIISKTADTITIKNPRFITFGIGILKKIKKLFKPVGGGDYIGWTSKRICDIASEKCIMLNEEYLRCSQCPLDKKIAIFTSLEFKTKGVTTTKDQKDWKELVEKSGGIAEVIKEGEF